MTASAGIGTIEAVPASQYRAAGYLVVRQVFAADSAQWRRLLYLSYSPRSDGGEQRNQHYAEFRGWLQDRSAEHGRTSTFFR